MDHGYLRAQAAVVAARFGVGLLPPGGAHVVRAGGPVKIASVTPNWGPPQDTVVALQSLASMTRPPVFMVCLDKGSPGHHAGRSHSIG